MKINKYNVIPWVFALGILSCKSAPEVSTGKEKPAFSGLDCVSGNCVDGTGQAKETGGDIYTGEFKDGRFHGEGSLQFAKGGEYTGLFRNGMVGGGDGVLTMPNGDQYIGHWENGRMNGIGTGSWVEGDKYIGFWKDNQFDGAGVLSVKGGLEYIGQWKDGSPNGAGVLKIPGGGVYKGTFETQSEIYDTEKEANYLPGRFYGKDGIVKKYTHIRSRDPKVKSGIFWEKETSGEETPQKSQKMESKEEKTTGHADKQKK